MGQKGQGVVYIRLLPKIGCTGCKPLPFPHTIPSELITAQSSSVFPLFVASQRSSYVRGEGKPSLDDLRSVYYITRG